MPPKRRPAKKEDDESEQKKQKVDEISQDVVMNDVNETNNQNGNGKIVGKDEDTEEDEKMQKAASTQDTNDDDDDLPDCMYGATCYRKNPLHFQQFRHPHVDKNGQPKMNAPAAKAKPVVAAPASKKASKDEDISPVKVKITADNDNISPMKDLSNNSVLDSYKQILQFTLSRNKITADDKRRLREYRRSKGVSENDHLALLKICGWTEDEYEDGEKAEDDFLDIPNEEKKILEEGRFEIITIRKEDTKKSKEYLHTFSKVCTKFYETMSKAQANYTITEVGVVVNSKLYEKFNKKRLELRHKNGEDKEDWGFHGTSRESIFKIAETGFLHPDDLKKLKMAVDIKDKKKGKKNKKVWADKPVELLDDGYYGKGIYFTKYSDYALWYSEERESDQILLSKLCVGKAYQCNKRMDGQGCVKGYDSHTSPKGNEIVVFDSAQILPRYIVTFVAKDAEEREQES